MPTFLQLQTRATPSGHFQSHLALVARMQPRAGLRVGNRLLQRDVIVIQRGEDGGTFSQHVEVIARVAASDSIDMRRKRHPVLRQPAMVLLQPLDRLHQVSVVADQQLREDMALLVVVVFASRPTEVVEDVGGELACLRVRPARCKPGDQRRKLAQREHRLPMADIQNVEAVPPDELETRERLVKVFMTALIDRLPERDVRPCVASNFGPTVGAIDFRRSASSLA